MTTSSDLAARILINYEASLKYDGKDSLAERIAAMTRTVEALQLEEGRIIGDLFTRPHTFKS